LENGNSNTAEIKETTTIDDTYAENLGYLVLQDSVFVGLAVQVPSWNFPKTSLVAAQIANRQACQPPMPAPSFGAGTAPAKVLSYANKSNPTDWMESYLDAASRHTERSVPAPPPGYAIPANK
jgi:hypothetical protein